MKPHNTHHLLVALLSLASTTQLIAQTTAFTYQKVMCGNNNWSTNCRSSKIALRRWNGMLVACRCFCERRSQPRTEVCNENRLWKPEVGCQSRGSAPGRSRSGTGFIHNRLLHN